MGSMKTDATGEITRLLIEWNEGDGTALERLMPKVVVELRKIAGRFFEHEDSGHTLQPTAVVSELYLRLVGRRRVSWKNRAHFFGFAAQSMRRILVDHARRKKTLSRGKGAPHLSLDEISEPEVASSSVDLFEIDDALRRLAELDPRQAKVAELRLFAGLTHEEIAEILDVTARTVKRDWHHARLWLRQELEP